MCERTPEAFQQLFAVYSEDEVASSDLPTLAVWRYIASSEGGVRIDPHIDLRGHYVVTVETQEAVDIFDSIVASDHFSLLSDAASGFFLSKDDLEMFPEEDRPIVLLYSAIRVGYDSKHELSLGFEREGEEEFYKSHADLSDGIIEAMKVLGVESVTLKDLVEIVGMIDVMNILQQKEL